MDNIRLILWFALLGTLWLGYTQWVEDYSSPPETAASPAAEPADTLPDINPAQPAADLPAPTPAGAPPAAAVEALPEAQETPASTVRVRTDVLDVLIDTTGGDLVRADLPEYPVDKDRPDLPVRLLDFSAGNRWVFQTGMRGVEGGPEPNHLEPFRSVAPEYQLSGDELVIRLDWAADAEISASKIYTFRRGSYRVGLDFVLENAGDAAWQGVAYTRMRRLYEPIDRSFTSVDSYSFRGPVLYDGDEYEKLDFDDLGDEPVSQTVTGGWLASIQHHFLAAAVPPPEESTQYSAEASGNEYLLTAISPLKDVPAGGRLVYTTQLFVGPKLQDQLRETGQELQLTVDYGIFTVLAAPMFWVLSRVYEWVRNWGVAIIIVTLIIKVVFYRLQATSGRSMARMRKLQPRMKALQERYKDDRQALGQATMELYKREKVNPAAGCLPILVQMPFFLAFYWVLIESVEMRQAPFYFWIDDLSVRDPFFVLPLLMGAAMFLQTRLNPAPPDPVQARVMQLMPLIFTVFFAFFPAGLVLYWLTNTLLSMLQQWRINVIVERENQPKQA